MSSRTVAYIVGGVLIPILAAWAYYRFTGGDAMDSFRGQAEGRTGKAAKFRGKPKEVNWQVLRQLDYKNGDVSNLVKGIDGKYVKVPGFVVPLEDNLRQLKQFLLVPTPMACIHTPPPPPNQIVLVNMEEEITIHDFYGAVWVFGNIQILEAKSAYGTAAYEMMGQKVETYEY